MFEIFACNPIIEEGVRKNDLKKDIEFKTDFGEIVKGMNVVDSIAKVPADSLDRPLHDVRIISAKLIKRRDYE